MAVVAARSSVAITIAVWRALFLREAVARISSGRTAWLWLLMEPMVHVAFLMFVFSVIRLRVVGGIDVAVWLMVGMLAFFMFRRPAAQSMNAVQSNRALFNYRQVKPVDTVLVRSVLEGFLMLIVSGVLLAGSLFVGLDIHFDAPLSAMLVLLGLWLVGLGFGLIASVLTTLVGELGNIIGLMMTPLYLASGVIFPISSAPEPYQTWLMYNPVAQGVEAIRCSFASYYQAADGVSIVYIYQFALVIIFIGLLLQVRFSQRLIMK